MKKLILLIPMLLAGCATLPDPYPSYEYSVITVCRAGADTIEQLTLLNAVEPFSMDDMVKIDKSIQALHKVCTSETIPDSEKMLTIAKSALLELLLVEQKGQKDE